MVVWRSSSHFVKKLLSHECVISWYLHKYNMGVIVIIGSVSASGTVQRIVVCWFVVLVNASSFSRLH